MRHTLGILCNGAGRCGLGPTTSALYAYLRSLSLLYQEMGGGGQQIFLEIDGLIKDGRGGVCPKGIAFAMPLAIEGPSRVCLCAASVS
jgi:hypothetical protein